MTPAMEKRKKEEAERALRAKLESSKKGPSQNDKPICRRIRKAREFSKKLGVPGGVLRDKDGLMKKPDIDIVIPLSGTMYLPHLRNCLASISRQTFPQEDIGITISCVMYESVDVEPLANLCMEHEAALIFTKRRHKSFSRGFALNVGARYGSRSLVAFVDADVYLHPRTLQVAAGQCATAVMAVIPVVRTDNGPKHPVWTTGNLNRDDFWRKFIADLPYAKGGYGNAVVRRPVFEQMHGHDERFFGWGGIDTDIYFRMLKSGRVVDLDEVGLLRALHQKHKPPVSKRDPENTKRNRRLLDQSKDIVRNPNRWGRVRCK